MNGRLFPLLTLVGLLILAATAASAATAPSSAVVGIPIDPSSLNPIQQMGEVAVILSQQINEPLVVLGPDAKFKPWLATSWTIVNPTTWRFQLRRGVKFTNGEPLTAQAVKFTMDEVRNPNNKAKFQPLIADVTDVKVIDDYTVEFATKAPNPIFLVQVARLFIMPPQHTQKVDTRGTRGSPWARAHTGSWNGRGAIASSWKRTPAGGTARPTWNA